MSVEEFRHLQYSVLPSFAWQQEGKNMDASLQDCTIEERGIVRFPWAEGVKPVEIHCRMLTQYGQSSISQRKVHEWVERFKSGRTRVTDEGRSGRPSTSHIRPHRKQLKSFFSAGIQKVVKRYNKCIVLQGD
jgi:hypothetical protein